MKTFIVKAREPGTPTLFLDYKTFKEWLKTANVQNIIYEFDYGYMDDEVRGLEITELHTNTLRAIADLELFN